MADHFGKEPSGDSVEAEALRKIIKHDFFASDFTLRRLSVEEEYDFFPEPEDEWEPVFEDEFEDEFD